MHIGILGGTFNPIHMGHLMMAEYISEELCWDKVLFIPTGNPPHKLAGVLEAEVRKAMVELAIQDNAKFQVSDIEVKRKGFSYSIDTVQELKREFPKDKLFFLIGSDILFDLRGWKRFGELAKSIEFVLAIRPGFENITRAQVVEETNFLKEQYNSNVTVIETPRYEISSTDLRERIKEEKSVKYLIPDNVIEYIKTNNLYKG